MKKITFRGLPDTKVKINTETAYFIFQECLKKSKTDKTGSIYIGLAESLRDELDDRYDFEEAIDSKYLINCNSRIENHKKRNIPLIGFNHTYIFRLAIFAGIDDYRTFDTKFSTAQSTPVLFTNRPFYLFEAIRVPSQGSLTGTADGWEYTDVNGKKISGDVTCVQSFIMPGDRNPLWLEITYNDHYGLNKAYFSEDTYPLFQPVSESNRLFRFFSKKVIE